MSRFSELVAVMCPDGVPHRRLGEIGTFARGKRFVKGDFVESGIPCIHYGEIYTRYGTWATEAHTFLTASVASRLRTASPGDVIIVATGETVDDVCKAVAWLGEDDVVIHDACYAFRHDLDPKYVSYVFQTTEFKRQVRPLVSRSKVVSILAAGLEKITIPVPPLAIQREIVSILDDMEKLQAELETQLESELQYRCRQYAHYRDSLLAFADRARVRWAPLSEIGSLYNGLSGKSKVDFQGGNARFISYVNVFNNPSMFTLPEDRVKVGENERQNRVRLGDILFTASSENVEDIGMSCGVTVEPAEPLYLNSFCFGFRPDDPNELNSEFAKHLFRSSAMRRQIIRTANGVTRINISKERFRAIELPIPDPAEQQRIADLLDCFEALVNDLSAGLPAEVTARREQYEYYRDQLFTFDEKAA